MDAYAHFAVTLLLSFGTAIAAYFAIPPLIRTLESRRLGRFLGVPPRWADRVFLVIVAAFAVGLITLSVLYYSAMNGFVRDLAIYDQIIWNSVRGRLFENTLIPDARFYLGKTFAPILLAFVPLYAVWSSPVALATVQVLAFSLSAFPIYWLARRQIGYALALVLCLAYFISPGIENSNIALFYEVVLATPVLAFAVFFLLRRHYAGFLVCLGLTLLFKEEFAFITIALGVFVLLAHRKRFLGLGLMLFGAVWAILLLQFAMPYLDGAGSGASFYYFDPRTSGGVRYGYLGSSLSEILKTIITHPDLVLQHVLIPDKIAFVFYHLVPLAFIPLLGAEVAALTIPTFGYTLLSNQAYPYDIVGQYRAPLLPLLFFATVVGARRLLNWRIGTRISRSRDPSVERAARKGALAVLWLVASTSTCYFQSGLPTRYLQDDRFVYDDRSKLENSLLETIPADAAVAAQGEFLARLSERQSIYEISAPDYRQVDYWVADQRKPWYDVHREFFEYYLATGYFETVVEQDGFLIARRRSPERTLNIQFGDEITLLGYSLVRTTLPPWGTALRPVAEWCAKKPTPQKFLVELNVVDAQGHVWARERRELQDGLAPTNSWKENNCIGDQYTLLLPPTMPQGEYQITVAMFDPATHGYLQARDEKGNWLGSEAGIGTVHVDKDKQSFFASQLLIEQPFFVDMQEMRFLGYVPPRKTITPGELLQVGLYWRAREKPRGNYVVAVQLRDAAGNVAFEQSSRPANDTYPTTQWDAGEVLLDWHDFNLPKDIAPGAYGVFVTLREAESQRELGETKVSDISILR